MQDVLSYLEKKHRGGGGGKSKCRKSLINNLFYQFLYICILKSIFIEQKLNENFAKMDKIVKIFNENERILFIHFCEFRATKISMDV